jgi:D-glycero-D-manno-heptose 1,7-bisphosphate phosphatase
MASHRGGGALGRRAVFFDRDGTLNRAVIRNARSYPPASLAEFELYPGVREELQALKQAGFVLIVATNQPDVGAGRQRRETVEEIHARLGELLPIDEIRVCYHTDADGCSCRKPLHGMLIAAAAERDLDLGASYMIGDRWRDVEAGSAAGCRTVFIRNTYDERQPLHYDLAVESVVDASRAILAGMV